MNLLHHRLIRFSALATLAFASLLGSGRPATACRSSSQLGELLLEMEAAQAKCTGHSALRFTPFMGHLR